MPSTDPIVLAAQARPVIAELHKRSDVVVRFKTDKSGYAEDSLDAIDKAAPGHFHVDKHILTLNLDELIPDGKALPEKLDSVEDFRKYPILAGVTAHEAGHARFSLWASDENPLPKSIPNPDFDPTATTDETDPAFDKQKTIEVFPVSETGKLHELARALEEPRIERLGTGVFSKTWRTGMQYSAGHLILEKVSEDDADNKKPLDAAVNLAILIGGRLAAGTLGNSTESRRAVNKVLDSAQAIIEEALPDVEDPYHKIMGLVSSSVFSNSHTDATPHLEAARQILEIAHPETAENPDKGKPKKGEPGEPGEGGGSAPGADGDEDGEGEGENESGDGPSPELAKMLADLKQATSELGDVSYREARQEAEEQKKMELDPNHVGHGATMYRDPRAPEIDHHEQPTQEDRDLYHRARNWMLDQIEPTTTVTERGQWMPGGGARLNVRNHIRDNLAGNVATQRSDWDRVSETVRPAPPVKVAIMLDGSGSMRRYARASASIAWAAANAAADLPESRTVSVVFGNAAAVTQQPGHVPARTVAVSRTDGGMEAFKEAAELVEEALWLNDEVEEGAPSNVLIIIISDLMYGGHTLSSPRLPQGQEFVRISKEWADKGYTIMVVGADPHRHNPYIAKTRYDSMTAAELPQIKVVTPAELFR